MISIPLISFLTENHIYSVQILFFDFKILVIALHYEYMFFVFLSGTFSYMYNIHVFHLQLYTHSNSALRFTFRIIIYIYIYFFLLQLNTCLCTQTHINQIDIFICLFPKFNIYHYSILPNNFAPDFCFVITMRILTDSLYVMQFYCAVIGCHIIYVKWFSSYFPPL